MSKIKAISTADLADLEDADIEFESELSPLIEKLEKIIEKSSNDESIRLVNFLVKQIVSMTNGQKELDLQPLVDAVRAISISVQSPEIVIPPKKPLKIKIDVTDRDNYGNAKSYVVTEIEGK